LFATDNALLKKKKRLHNSATANHIHGYGLFGYCVPKKKRDKKWQQQNLNLGCYDFLSKVTACLIVKLKTFSSISLSGR